MDLVPYILLTISLVNAALAVKQFPSNDASERGLLDYIMWNIRRHQNRQSEDLNIPPNVPLSSIYPEIVEEVAEAKPKKSSIYGINRPMKVRQTRLASFGTMIIPNQSENLGRNAPLRYG